MLRFFRKRRAPEPEPLRDGPHLYGKRRVDRMLKQWDAHRKAVAGGDFEKIQKTFDACEEWIDFAFGRGR